MSLYCQFLKSKYEPLELISIDAQLNCSSSRYITLTLIRIDGQGRNTMTLDRRGDSVTLSEVLDDSGMGKSTLAINICKCWAEGSLLQNYSGSRNTSSKNN